MAAREERARDRSRCAVRAAIARNFDNLHNLHMNVAYFGACLQLTANAYILCAHAASNDELVKHPNEFRGTWFRMQLFGL
jgi:hypothetical protein